MKAMMLLLVLFSFICHILSTPSPIIELASLGTEIRATSANSKLYFTYNTGTESKYIIFTDLADFKKKSEGQLEPIVYNANYKIAAFQNKEEAVIAQQDSFTSFAVTNDVFTKKADHLFQGALNIAFWEVVPLSDNTLLIIAVQSSTATLRKYDNSYNEVSTSPLPVTISMLGNSISCVEFVTTRHLFCAYHHPTIINTEYYNLYDLTTFTEVTTGSIEQKSQFSTHGELITLLAVDRVLVCTLKYESSNSRYYLYCFVGLNTLVNSNYQIKQISPMSSSSTPKDYAVIADCDPDIKYASIAKVSINKFVNICLHKTVKTQFVFSSVICLDNVDMDWDKPLFNGFYTMAIGSTVAFNSLVVYSSELIGLFYTQGSSPNEAVKFQLLNGPNCEDYTVPTQLLINSQGTFTFPTSTFVNGMLRTSDPIKVSFNLNLGESLTILNNNVAVTPADLFLSTETFTFNSGTTAKATIQHDFIAKNSAGNGIHSCKISFTVLACHTYCLKCSVLGTNTDMKCDECDAAQFVYPYANKPGMCYLKTSPPPKTVFNPDTNTFEDCFFSCETCSKKGIIMNDMFCTSCDLTKYYPLVDDIQMTKCFDEAMKLPGTYLDSIDKVFKYCKVGCSRCIFENLKEVCQICDSNNQYYPLSDNPGLCVNEQTKPKNYYLKNGVYEPCYETCATCTQGGTATDHNCDTCALVNSIQLIKQPLKETNCVTECSSGSYWYVDADFEYHCTTTTPPACPISYPYFVEGTTQCTDSCASKANCVACNLQSFFKYEGGKQCVTKCPAGTQANMNTNECENSDVCRDTKYPRQETAEDFAKVMDQVVLNYSKIYDSTDKQVDVLINANYKVVIYKNETCAYTLQPDLGKLDLAECIKKLRDHYYIPITIPLITLTMDQPRTGQPNQVSYAFYNSIDGSRLDMELCKEEKIIVTVPIGDTDGVDLDKAKEFEDLGVDVYNESDPFFNDICFEYSTNDGRDVTLTDRKKAYYQNVSVCEEGCTYKGVNLTMEEVSCECEVKTSFITEILDNPLTGELLAFFNQANFDIVKCYEDVFNAKKFVKNIGSWILLGLIIIQCGFLIVYIQVGVYPVEAFLLKYIKVNPPKKTKVTEESQKEAPRALDEIEEENHIKIDFNNNSPSVPLKHDRGTSSSQKLKMISLNQNYLDMPDPATLTSGKVLIGSSQKDMKPLEAQTTRPEDEEEFDDFELNDQELEDALEHDKRGFCLIYWQLLQENQTFISTFFNRSPLESFPIKAICFFFSIALFFCVNAIFYDESYISKQFESKEPFNLLYLLKNELNRCIYSTIVAIAVNIILSFLFSSKRKIKGLIKRHKDNQDKLRSESLKILKGMRITNTAFLVVNFIFMLAFWYFVSAFCAIFRNSVGSWLIGCAITWILTFLFPFPLYFLATSLRVMGMKCNCELFYRISLLLT